MASFMELPFPFLRSVARPVASLDVLSDTLKKKSELLYDLNSIKKKYEVRENVDEMSWDELCEGVFKLVNYRTYLIANRQDCLSSVFRQEYYSTEEQLNALRRRQDEYFLKQ